MARKRYTAEQIIGHLREAEILLSKGKTVADSVECAKGTLDVLGDRDQAKVIFDQAGENCKSGEDFAQLAKGIIETIEDTDLARSIFSKGEREICDFPHSLALMTKSTRGTQNGPERRRRARLFPRAPLKTK